MEIIIEGGDIEVDIFKIHQSSPFGKVTGEQLMLQWEEARCLEKW